MTHCRIVPAARYYLAVMLPESPSRLKVVAFPVEVTVWATGSKIPQLESMINSYLRDVSIYLKDNSLLIFTATQIV